MQEITRGQASVTSSGPFRDCSCQFVQRPQNSRSVDTRQVNAFKEDWGANVHTQECQVCRCATNLGVSGRFESKRLVILPPLPVPPSSTGDRRSKAWRRHAFSSHVLPYHRTKRCLFSHLLNQAAFQSLLQRFAIRTFYVFVDEIIVRFAFALSASQVHLIKKRGGLLQIKTF